MQAKSNPFNPNSIVPTNLFAGRANYCLNILRKLSETKKGRPSSFFLYGERGIGKSALAKLIGYVSTQKDPKLYGLRFVVSYYSVAPGQSFRSVIEASLNGLTDSIPASWLQKLSSRLGGLLKNGKFSLGAFGASMAIEPGKGDGQEDVVLKDQATSILSNLVTALKESHETEAEKDGILVIIDEVQNLKDLQIAAPTLRGIQNSLDFKGLGNVSFLLLGLDQAFEFFMEGDASARRMFDPIRLGVMPDDEAMEVLEKGFSEAGLQWDENELKRRIIVTGGYPHSIQIVGHNLVDIDTDGIISKEDWDAAVNRTAGELREKEFSEMYSFSGQKTGREKILDAIAVLGPMPKKELKEVCQRAYKLTNPYQYIPKLVKIGAVKIQPDGAIELQSQLFRTAILATLLPSLSPDAQLLKMFMERFEKGFSPKASATKPSVENLGT